MSYSHAWVTGRTSYVWQASNGSWYIANGGNRHFRTSEALRKAHNGWEHWQGNSEWHTENPGEYVTAFHISQDATAAMCEMSPFHRANGVTVKPYKRRRVSTLPFCYVNVKRSDEFNETNDCTVVALMQTTGVSYDLAHAHALAHGRKNRQGFSPLRMLGENTLGHRFTKAETKLPEHLCYGKRRWSSSYMTIDQFIAANPVGTFYVCTTSHAFAIYDGMIFDHTKYCKGRSRLHQAWKVEKI